MGRVWSEENKFQKWLDVELAATETLAEAGTVPREAAAKLRERARVDVARINEIEAKVRHDVIAFTIAVQETVGDPEAARWLHYGLTSNDVVDTAQALLIREASQLIEKGIERFGEILEKRAWEFKDTPEIGRTHGIHAEPITFGLKVANWYAENRRDAARFQAAARKWPWERFPARWAPARIWARKSSRKSAPAGPGNRADHLAGDRARPPRAVSGDARDLAASLERIAQEIRHLQRTEVREVEGAVRRRAARQFGHAAQAQSRFERADLRAGARGAREFAGGAREYRAVARARYFAQLGRARHPAGLDHPRGLHAAPHHRDRHQHEGVSRERMLRNLNATQGLVFSGQLLQDLVEHGAPREDAYKWVQGTPWRRGNRRPVFRSASPPIPTFASSSTKRRSRTHSICSASCAPWTPFFARVFGARNPPPLERSAFSKTLGGKRSRASRRQAKIYWMRWM
jgi:adenylosuccinate lyase